METEPGSVKNKNKKSSICRAYLLSFLGRIPKGTAGKEEAQKSYFLSTIFRMIEGHF